MISAQELSRALGQQHGPTAEQAAVIEAPCQSMLVIAGAGAGKTETMAARVVWLVANNLVRPDQILGLTFTNKAAQGLSKRIRTRLQQLAAPEVARTLDPSGQLQQQLAELSPTVSTYDSLAAKLVQEFGLYLPVDPSQRLVSETEQFQIVYDLVRNSGRTLPIRRSEGSIVADVLKLDSELVNHMVSIAEAREATHTIIQEAQAHNEGKEFEALRTLVASNHQRLLTLDLVEQFRQYCKDNKLASFVSRQAAAVQLAQKEEIQARYAQRYQVVLLDEYQDTSHAQREMLRTLLKHQAVTAVGDPMQSIYGWRGAAVQNLLNFDRDFSKADQPVLKYSLTCSFRNPEQVLNLANQVVDQAFESADRPVDPLQSMTGEPGEVRMLLGIDEQDEIEQAVSHLASKLEASTPGDFTGAILVRDNTHVEQFAAECRRQNLPHEVMTTGNILQQPEIRDLVAFATLLIRPADDRAALRILMGPKMELGIRDLQALGQRAKHLAGRAEKTPRDPDPLAQLHADIEEQLAIDADQHVGLGDALADLGDPAQYSEPGYARLKVLAQQLRYLRKYSLNQGLSALFRDIADITGLRTEVLTHAQSLQSASVQLETFAACVEAFESTGKASLAAFLDYLDSSLPRDSNLKAGAVQVRGDRIQILTIHMAKGLEWQHVVVAGCSEHRYVKQQSPERNWLTYPGSLPGWLRKDADEANFAAYPVFSWDNYKNQTAFNAQQKQYREQLKEFESYEALRLFYVGITRAERSLLLSSHCNKGINAPFRKLLQNNPQYEQQLHQDFLASVRTRFPDIEKVEEQKLNELMMVVSKRCSTDPLPAQRIGVYPPTYQVSGGEEVHNAMQSLPALATGYEHFKAWEEDVSALIEERSYTLAPVVEVALPSELNATELSALRSDTKEFARRIRRPVPFKPNRYAKRGTAFHEWLEEQFQQPALLSEDELPGADETPVTHDELKALQEAFQQGPFADRTPVEVEFPFSFTLAGKVIKGRIDAIFQNQDGSWQIIDWKTGAEPKGADLTIAATQLAVYKVAFARAKGIDPDQIHAAFYYVRQKKLLAPQLPGAQALEDLIRLGNPLE